MGAPSSTGAAIQRELSARHKSNTDLALEDQLKRGEFVLSLTTGVLDADRLVKRTLFQEPVMLCIPRGHELYEKKAVGMEDLDGRHFVMFSTQFFVRHKFDALCGEAGIKPVIDYISNDFNSLFGLAQQYGLLFAAPLHCVGSLGEQCRYTPFPDSRFEWDVCMVRERHPELTGMAAVLWDHLENAVPGRL